MRVTLDDYILTATLEFKEGRFFNELESRGGINVCVIGYDVADALFPAGDSLNKSVLINGQAFKVIGTITRQGSFLGLFSLDSIVVMPLPAFQKYFSAKSDSDILVKVRDKSKLTEAKEELTGLMRRVRHLPPEKADDFSINEQQALKSTLDPIKNSIAIADSSSPACRFSSVLIMNTFVSVKERTGNWHTQVGAAADHPSSPSEESTATCLWRHRLTFAYLMLRDAAAFLISIHFV